MPAIGHVAFAGDDTLWHHEPIHAVTQERFRALVESHVPGADVDGRLREIEARNLEIFGYGLKGFTLSMIETAVEVTDGAIPATDIAEIIAWGKALTARPVDLVDGAAEALAALDGRFELMVVAEGDLFDQESKLARSGLAAHFEHVEVVARKDARTYRRILERRRIAPAAFVMVGSSLNQDVLPVVAIGGHAVHVAYPIAWQREAAAGEALPEGAHRLTNLAELPGLLETIDG